MNIFKIIIRQYSIKNHHSCVLKLFKIHQIRLQYLLHQELVGGVGVAGATEDVGAAGTTELREVLPDM